MQRVLVKLITRRNETYELNKDGVTSLKLHPTNKFVEVAKGDKDDVQRIYDIAELILSYQIPSMKIKKLKKQGRTLVQTLRKKFTGK